jgi:hypothetical protein
MTFPQASSRAGKSLIVAIGDTTRGTSTRQTPQALPLWDNQGKKTRELMTVSYEPTACIAMALKEWKLRKYISADTRSHFGQRGVDFKVDAKWLGQK